MIDKIKDNPRLKKFVIGLISPHKHPRPRLWVRWFVNPFVHKKGRGALIRRHARLDVFPWRRFEVGRDALIEDYAVVNNGAGDVLIGDAARIGIGSVVIGPVRMGDRAGLGQHVFISGFNHGYADGTRDSNEQELVRKEVVIGRESHIGANSVVVAHRRARPEDRGQGQGLEKTLVILKPSAVRRRGQPGARHQTLRPRKTDMGENLTGA